MFNKRVGEIFEFEGRKLKVCREYGVCKDINGNTCVFYDEKVNGDCRGVKEKGLRPACPSYEREDGLEVCFIEEVKSKKMILMNLDNGKGIKIKKHGLSKCYNIIGENTGLIYGVFKPLTNDLEVEHKDAILLKELGFELIEPRKSWLEIYDECEEVPFVIGECNWFVRKEGKGRVSSNYYGEFLLPNFKYISKEDAERIVRECAENNE